MGLLILVGVLIAIGAVWLVLRPVATTVGEGAGDQYNQLSLVRERLLVQLNDLDIQRADGGIDTQVASDEQRRLQAELAQVLHALDSLETAREGEPRDYNPRPVHWLVIAGLAVGVPLIALILYVGGNKPTLLALMSGSTSRVAQAPQVQPMVADMVARLEKRLAEQPNDVLGWARLGRSYRVLERPADSKKAYAMAYKLAPDNIDIVADYAALVYEENPQNTEGVVFELFNKLYSLAPTNPGALWFLGLAAFQKGEFRTSASLWEQLKAQLPADSPIMVQLTQAITQAEGRWKQQ